MKKLLLLMGMLFSLILLSLPSYSQNRPTITRVSEGGAMTVYDKVNCLENAIDAAKTGDVLYLSAGTFSSSTGVVYIKDKIIQLVGSGLDSKILPIMYVYKVANTPYNWNGDALFNGLQLGTVIFYQNYSSNADFINLNIKNCSIDSLGMSDVKTASIENCKIRKFGGDPYCTTELKNCKIETLHAQGPEHITNCNINKIHVSKIRYIGSSIIGNLTNGFNEIFMENCVIPESVAESDDIRNCYRVSDISTILDSESLEAKVDLKEKGYLGFDGSVVGIYGGLWTPYTELPSVPTVDAKKSSVEYDPTANKLKVNIQMLKESK